MYTRGYTIVYTRVHNCIPTCTLSRSKYVPCRALSLAYLSGIVLALQSCRSGSLGNEIIFLKSLRVEHAERLYTSASDASRGGDWADGALAIGASRLSHRDGRALLDEVGQEYLLHHT